MTQTAVATPPALEVGAQAQQDVPLTPSPTTAPKPYAPSRASQFHFEAGGPVSDANLKNYFVEMTCAIDGKEVGTMSFELWGDDAPRTARNFLRYCDEGFYDGLTFHRILRDFMLQGGDPKGTGQGDGPHGQIQAEFSDAPERAHQYGVLSMARGQSPNSASSQFFLICDDQPSVWNLDNQYASFGRMTSGAAILEILANTPTRSNGREKADPLKRVTMTSVVVKEGVAPQKGETMARVMPELPAGEVEQVTVQHILISFKDAIPGPTRSKEEAKQLADTVFARVQAGENFDALLREYTDDNMRPGDTRPGTYLILNHGRRDIASDRLMFDLNKQIQDYQKELQAEMQAQKMTMEAARAAFSVKRDELAGKIPETMATQRDRLVPAFGDVGFSLQVGEVGLAPHQEKSSPFGWHIIKRLN